MTKSKKLLKKDGYMLMEKAGECQILRLHCFCQRLISLFFFIVYFLLLFVLFYEFLDMIMVKD